MKHITEEYGMDENLLELTLEEYKVLDAFLSKLGVRSRVTLAWTENGVDMVKIQAENPYWACIRGHDKKFADSLMEPFSLECYKR